MLVLLQPFLVPSGGGCSKAAMDGPDGVRSAERELPLSTAQGQGPGTRDQRPGIREHSKVSRWGSH